MTALRYHLLRATAPDYDGFVYIVSNPLFDGNLFKIGRMSKDSYGKNPLRRFHNLHKSTGMPEDFHIHVMMAFHDHKRMEKEIHRKSANYRMKGTEFFKVGSVEDMRDVAREFAPDAKFFADPIPSSLDYSHPS